MKEKAVKPYHRIQHLGRHCVIDIEEMQASAIDEAAARMLTRHSAAPAAPMEPDVREQLAQLGLLMDGDVQPPKEAKSEPVPLASVALFLIQSCNMRCVYCYGDGGSYGTGGEMSEQTAFRAVDWLIEQSGKMKQINVGFFGGEPFLRISLMRAVVAYARQRAQAAGKEVSFDATTNGTLLDDETVAFILEQKMSVQVSFDGPREIQDAQRPLADGKGSYDVIVPGIKRLLAVAPKTPAHAVLAGQTDPQLVKDALRDLGFTRFSIVPASVPLFAGQAGAAAPKRDIEAVIKLVEVEAQDWVGRIRERDIEGTRNLRLKGQLSKALLALLHNAKRFRPCGAGIGMLGVSCAGDVYLCHRFVGMSEYRLGDVFHQDWDRDRFGKSPVLFVEACIGCFARYYCAGGCKHDNAGACGSAFTPAEDFCRLMRRELELAAAVIGQLDPADRAFLAEHDIIPAKPCPLDF